MLGLLVALACSTVTGMVIDLGDDGVDNREDDNTKQVKGDGVELYHPGSPPSHITRLGRFHHDKSGVALLGKADAAFMDRNKPLASLHQSVEKPDVVLMPSSYHKVIREHQKEHKAKHLGATADTKERKSKPDAAMVQQTQVPNPDPSADGVLIPDNEDPANNPGGVDSVIMPLKLLRSEYMGPMGVGTMLPKHCRPEGVAGLAAGVSSNRHGRRHRRKKRATGALDRGADKREGTNADQNTEKHDEDDGDVSVLESDSSPETLEETSSSLSRDPTGGPNSTDCVARQQTYLNVVYDTGSTNIWISSDLCTTGGCVLPGRRRFNHLESTTFSYPKDSPTLSVQFGTGKLAGPLGTDNLRVGPVSVHQTFAMMEHQAGWIWEDVPIEGIVGLGFPSLANTDGHPPFFDSVIQQKALKRNEFAFYVSRENPAANAIMWGGVDSRFYAGQIEWFPVIDPHYWALELVQFRVGNVSFNFPKVASKTRTTSTTRSTSVGLTTSSRSSTAPSNAASPSLATTTETTMEEDRSRRFAGLVEKPPVKPHGPVAVLDTGTSILGFAGSLVTQLVNLLPETSCTEVLDDGANGTEVKYPDMVFVLRNKAGQVREWALTRRQYMSRDEDGDMCSPAIMTLDLPKDHGPGLVLGDVFLREYFSVYSRRDGTPSAADIGLARAKRTEDIVEHLRSLTDGQQSLLHT